MPKIVLDPGHGGSDSGAVNGNHLEKNFNLSIALKVRDYLLRNYDVEVLMTRTTDTAVSLSERTNMANRNSADYYCSIHVNAGGGTGFESYIYNGAVSNRTGNAQRIIHNEVMNRLSSYGVRDRGMKRANFHVLRETRMPAILLENLFIDNNVDLRLLRNQSFQHTLGIAISEGIAKAMSLKKFAVTDVERGDQMQRVMAGSFAIRDNAERRKNYLNSNGIEAVVVRHAVGSNIRYRIQAGAFRNRDLAEARLNAVIKLGITDAYITAE